MVWLKNLAIELSPLVLFFIVEKQVSFFAGVGALIAATLVSFVYAWFVDKRIPYFALFSLATLGLFGGISIVFKNANVFVISDNLINVGFAIALYSSLWFKTPLLKTLFESSFAITDQAWRILTRRWSVLFLALAVVSEAVRQLYSVDTWVQFKALSVVIILVFGFYQFTLSRKMRLPEVSNNWGLRIK